MSVAGYKVKINGGAFSDTIIDVGLVSPTQYLKTGLAPSTLYHFSVLAYDNRGNPTDQSAGSAFWSTVWDYTTPATSIIWTNYVSAEWSIDGSQNLTALTNTFLEYEPEVVPRFTTIGDYIIFKFTGGSAYGHILLADTAAHIIKTYASSQIDDESGFQGYYAAYADGDLIKIRKSTSTRFEVSVNGGTPIEITKDMTGTVTAHIEMVTVVGNIIGVPTTNIPY